MKNIYHARIMENVGYVFKCKFCGTKNVVEHEYSPFEWENCELCNVINVICPSLEDEETQDRIHGNPHR